MATKTRTKNFKDSGVEWIGKIPQDWSVQKLKYVTRFGYGESLPDEKRIEGDIKVYGSNGVVGTNQIAITKGETIIVGRKGSYGKIQLSSEPCFPIDTTFYIDKTQTHHELRWLYYVLQTLNLDTGSQDSTVPGLSREHAYSQIVTVPRGDEEARVASFLDSKTSIVDNAIEQKRKLIDLLKEKRTAIINRAVTRGLDENVELVDSGVEWIGKVPKGWMIYKLKQVARLVTGGTPPKVESSYYSDDEGIPWVKPDDLNEFIEITNSKEKLTPLGASISNVVPKGSVLVNCIGDVGNIGIAGNNIATNQQINSVIFGRLVNGDFGKYMIQNSKPRMDAASNKVVVAILNKTQQGNLSYLIPPILVQQKIARYLDDKLSNIDEVVSKIEKSIALLREYRTSLISHVVTGKVEL